MRFVPANIIVFAITASAATVACSGQPAKSASQGESVPANSFSDARLRGDDQASRPERSSDPSEASVDPTQPYTTRVGDAPAPAKNPEGGRREDGARAGGVVSKPECDRLMERYLELEISKNPELKGLPSEVIEQAKELAREQHGDAPCTANRAQYTCGMAAKSTAAWQRCMK